MTDVGIDTTEALVESQKDEPVPEPSAPPLAGRRQYSPAAIAIWTLLSNAAVGLILYGLNLRARGERRMARVMLAFGFVSLPLLIVSSMQAEPSRAYLLQIVIALYIYKLERLPFESAIHRGATRARWWPPGLCLIGLGLFLLALQYLVG
jgi:hypothetical protein